MLCPCGKLIYQCAHCMTRLDDELDNYLRGWNDQFQTLVTDGLEQIDHYLREDGHHGQRPSAP